MPQYIFLFLMGCSALFSLHSCTYTQRVKDGKTAYERRQYARAIPMLEKEYKKAKENRSKGENAYMLAESHRRLNQAKEASNWYQKAVEHQVAKDAALQQARMLQMLQDYDEAAKAYRMAGRQAGDINRYRLQVQACEQAKQWLADTAQLYSIEELEFNSPDNDFAPVLLSGDKELIFSSDRQENEGKELYKWTNRKFFNLYLLDIESQKTKRWEASFNKEYHQGTLSFSQDGERVYFTACGSAEKKEVEYCQIMESRKNGSQWSQPKALWFCRNMNYNFMHPMVSKDGRFLFFAANNKRGFGGYDLYWCSWLVAEEKWSEPKNMGSSINTAGDEVFPYADADTLYFSSNGHPGMGGLDLFRVERIQDKWHSLENLRYPINSGGDDFALAIDYSSPKADSNVLQQGYFTSSRLGGKGGDDIYHFQRFYPPIPDTPSIDTPALDTPAFAIRVNLEGLVKEKVLVDKSKANSEIEGYAQVPNVAIEVMSEDTVFILGSNELGEFSCLLKEEQNYLFRVNKAGYFKQEAELSTFDLGLDEEKPDTTLYVELILDRIYTNQEITLENIYYDYNQSFIREDARPPLDSLTQILKKNAELRIQLASHTDCRGSARYNQSLSQKRAEAAVQYLIGNGIDPERLLAKGFGEEQPAMTCKCEECTEEEHQANRRTTFMILAEE